MPASLPKPMRWLPWVGLVILAAVCMYVLLLEANSELASLPGTIISFVGAVIVFLLLALAIEGMEQEVEKGEMQRWLRRLLYWTPRAVALLFTAFVSIFALDVFGAGYSAWETAVALFMHLIPTFVLLAAIAIAWRWEWVGAAALTGWAVWYSIRAWGNFPFSVYLLLAILPLTVGLLFLINWLFRQELHQ